MLATQSVPQLVLGAEHSHLTLLPPIFEMRKLRLRGANCLRTGRFTSSSSVPSFKERW